MTNNPENLPHILEFEWRRLAFFERVPLEDLGILYPLAAECETKEQFMAPDLERLGSLVALAEASCPSEVTRLSQALPQVARLLGR
jgi:hypothetical protein